MSDDLKTVARYNTPMEADLARNRLEAAGIQAFTADDQTVGWLWHLGATLQGIKVQVAESDLAQAIEVLDYPTGLPAEAEPIEPWACPKCGVRVEGDFEVCWACGTTVDGVEDPDFQPASTPAPMKPAEQARRDRTPGPLLALMFGFCVPAAVVNALVGINLFVAEVAYPFSTSVLLLLVACEFLLAVGLFQWWYYQPPSERVEIPADRDDAQADKTPWPDEAAEPEIGPGEAMARRACLAAVLGVAFCPPLLNLYSFWLILTHGLFREEVSGRAKWLVYVATVINVAVCSAILLLWLLWGGLSAR